MGKARKRAQRAVRRKTNDSIAEYNAKADREAHTGGDVSAVSDSDLFFVDKEPCAASAARLSKRQRRLNNQVKPTRVETILAVKPTVQYPEASIVKKQKFTTNSTKQRMLKTQKAGHVVPAGKGVSSRAVYDLWDDVQFQSHNQQGAEGGGAGGGGGGALLQLLQETQTKKVTRGAVKKHEGVKTGNNIPAVQVDAEGSSFNPPKDAHQEVLAQAVAVEMEKEYKKDLLPRGRITLGQEAGALLEAEIFRTHQESDEDEEDEEQPGALSAGGAAQQQQGVKSSKVVLNKKLTKAERNKQASKAERRRTMEAEAKQKKMSKQLNQIKDLQKEIEEQERQRELERDRRAQVKQEKADKMPRKLGKRRYEEEQVEVQLTEEVTGSIRQLKGCSTLLRSRFKSLQKRELIEPRMPLRAKKSKQFKEYEPGTKGEKERESHAALMANRNLGRSIF